MRDLYAERMLLVAAVSMVYVIWWEVVAGDSLYWNLLTIILGYAILALAFVMVFWRGVGDRDE